jgi:hypothetical protein
MKTPAPVATITAKISAFEDYHPRLFGVVLVVGAVLLIGSGLREPRASTQTRTRS